MNIYISNLDQKVTAEDLINLFTPHGEVKTAEIMMDAFTGKSRGIAYVEMPDDAAAQNAISQLNNVKMNDSTLSVKEAQPKAEHRGSYPLTNEAGKKKEFQRSYSYNTKGSSKKRR